MTARILSITGPTGLSNFKLVNVVTSVGPTGGAGGQIKFQTQSLSGNTGASIGEIPTYWLAPSGTTGILTICIPGFTAPS
jgi:hypothetical protein